MPGWPQCCQVSVAVPVPSAHLAVWGRLWGCSPSPDELFPFRGFGITGCWMRLLVFPERI